MQRVRQLSGHCLAGLCEGSVADGYDIIIRNGTIYDGLRTPCFVSDMGIRKGKIATIGRIANSAPTEKTIDATGLNVCPGFIDVLTHFDAQLFWDPYCTASGWHGVTTVVIGSSGVGCAPCKNDDASHQACLEALEKAGAGVSAEAQANVLPWDWESFPDYMGSLAKTPKGVNVHAFLPLGQVIANAGSDKAAMIKIVDEALEAGAAGISVVEGSLPDDDLAAVAKTMEDSDGGVIVTDTGSTKLLESLADASGRPVMTTAGGLTDSDGNWIKDANTMKGHRIFCSGLGCAEEYEAAPEAELKKVLAGQFTCPGGSGGGGASTAKTSGAWATALLGGCIPASKKVDPEVAAKAKAKAKGKSKSKAKAKGKAAAKAKAKAKGKSKSKAKAKGKAAAKGKAKAKAEAEGEEEVVEPVLSSLEDMHWKASKYPAMAVGILDRGYIGEDAPADVLVYDPSLIRITPATEMNDLPGGGARQVSKPAGYKFIIVNGQVTFEDDQCTGATPGKLLRAGRAEA